MGWVVSNWDQIVALTLNHVRISVLPILLSLVLSIPLGWWAHRRRGARRVPLTSSGLL